MRGVLAAGVAAAVALGGGVARADVRMAGHHRLPSEVLFQNLGAFPSYRFFVAPVARSAEAMREHGGAVPAPVEAREGEAIDASGGAFLELRAVPRGSAPEAPTEAWLAGSGAPSSGSFSRHSVQVLDGSGERKMRYRFRVQRVDPGWVALEPLAAVYVMADGAEQPFTRPAPLSWQLGSIALPPGWGLFLMPDPSWPRGEPLTPRPCSPGQLLEIPPGPALTLVAGQGEPAADGSFGGRPSAAWGVRVHGWSREDVHHDSAAVAVRDQLEVRVAEGQRLEVIHHRVHQDEHGDWFEDPEARLYPVSSFTRRRRLGLGALTAVVALAAGAWALARRRSRDEVFLKKLPTPQKSEDTPRP